MKPELEKYILDISSPEDEILAELYRKTHTSVLNPHMISGHMQGKLLEMMVRLLNPLNILEIGTYTGYSAICMARGLSVKGHLHTIEINDELSDINREYAEKAGLTSKITFHTGDARQIMREMNITFDLVYIDADKRQYAEYYELAVGHLQKNGFILADNALWGGKVINQQETDSMTEGIREFNKMVSADHRTENIVIPVFDGLMLIRKI